jgi:hypothetical protein
MRIEACPRGVFNRRFLIDVSLKEKIARTNASDTFEGELRMFQVVEHAIKQYHVECAQPLRIQVVNIHQKCRSVRLPGQADSVEAPHGVGEGVDADDFARAPALRFE